MISDGSGGIFPSSNSEDDKIILAARRGGGIPKSLWNLSVREFVSRYCSGQINREVPGQFEGISISDLIEIAKGGDAAAKKCYKLLNEPRFRKK